MQHAAAGTLHNLASHPAVGRMILGSHQSTNIGQDETATQAIRSNLLANVVVGLKRKAVQTTRLRVRARNDAKVARKTRKGGQGSSLHRGVSSQFGLVVELDAAGEVESMVQVRCDTSTPCPCARLPQC
jgi:hypothetical protein